MKLKPTLPENIFMLNEDQLPTEKDSDPNEKVMVYRKDAGWLVCDLKSVYSYCKDLKFTHWTFTPEVPDV